MSTTPDFAQYILEQLSSAGEVTCRKMFGEYGLYLDGKFIALLCDNQLYIKPTRAGRSFLKTPDEQPPYPGAGLYFLIAELENKHFLAELLQQTWRELPFPKPKKKKA